MEKITIEMKTELPDLKTINSWFGSSESVRCIARRQSLNNFTLEMFETIKGETFREYIQRQLDRWEKYNGRVGKIVE